MRSAAAVAVAGVVCAAAGAAAGMWEDSLTLSPRFSQPSPSQTKLDWPELPASPLNIDVSPSEIQSSPRGPRVEVTDVFDGGSAVEVRIPEGLGLGFTTDASWSISYAVPINQSLSLSVYYLRRIEAGRSDPSQTSRIKPDEPPEQSGGLRLQWEF